MAHPAREVRQGGVEEEPAEVGAVGGREQLHAALGDRARRVRLEGGADLVDHDDLGHVVFHCFNHYRVLFSGSSYLHAPGMPDSGMRDVAIPGQNTVPIRREFAGNISEIAKLHMEQVGSRQETEVFGLARSHVEVEGIETNSEPGVADLGYGSDGRLQVVSQGGLGLKLHGDPNFVFGSDFRQFGHRSEDPIEVLVT